MRGPTNKTCESCGRVFECVGYQCWCGKMGVTDRQMDWISARYEECLCQTCLANVATGELAAPLLRPVRPTGEADVT